MCSKLQTLSTLSQQYIKRYVGRLLIKILVELSIFFASHSFLATSNPPNPPYVTLQFLTNFVELPVCTILQVNDIRTSIERNVAVSVSQASHHSVVTTDTTQVAPRSSDVTRRDTYPEGGVAPLSVCVPKFSKKVNKGLCKLVGDSLASSGVPKRQLPAFKSGVAPRSTMSMGPPPSGVVGKVCNLVGFANNEQSK